MNWRHLVVASCLGALAASVCGQTLMSRGSTLNYNYVFGAGGDIHVGDDTATDAALLPGDVEGIGFSDSTSGVLPNGLGYSAAVFSDLDLEYSVAGPISGFHSIVAGATSHVVASTTGAGTAAMFSSNPGNGLILTFTVSDPTPFHLTGWISHPNPMAFSFVALQYFDGIVWQNGVFNSIFLPGGQGAFDVAGTLAPGLYRMNSALSLNVNTNQDLSAAYSYQLSVPEPGSLGTLLIGAALATWRMRR